MKPNISNNTRNVAIIAHIDHGKATLSDLLLERAGLLNKKRSGSASALDSSRLEQAYGINSGSSVVRFCSVVSLKFDNLGL